MSDGADIPGADQLDGAPHPRETRQVLGHDTEIQQFLDAYNADRLHHGWLITGPKGVGKATLAWAIARFLLATPPAEGGLFGAPPPVTTLDIDPEHPVATRIQALSEPGLFPISRSLSPTTGKLRQEIVVDDIRALGGFLSLSAAEGGGRVVIVDSADEMNVSAANALLKRLEEPPARTTLLLISHQPSRLLPTIRSRCRSLRLSPLNADDLGRALIAAGQDIPLETVPALADLAAGSVGEAIRLSASGGLDLYGALVALFADLPALDRTKAITLSELAAQRGGEAQFELLVALFDLFLSRVARSVATGTLPAIEAAPGEHAMLERLISDGAQRARTWAECQLTVSERLRHGRAVNLDPAGLVLDTVFMIQKTAGRI